MIVLPISGCVDPNQAPPQQDRRLHHPPDEASAAFDGARYLHQAAGGGKREKGQLRPGRLGFGTGHHRGRRGHQGDAQDDGLPEHSRIAVDQHQDQRRRIQQKLNIIILVSVNYDSGFERGIKMEYV